MTKPSHVSLFTGIGGIDLAADWAGFETVAMCEANAYCRRVLAKHWPGVPCWEDVRELSAIALRERGIGRVDLLSGGFPCQPFSNAGKQLGKADERHLWPAMLRVVSEVRPTWVLGENVAGFVSMALDDVCADLEGAGYKVAPFLVPASGVGAWHQRKRCFIVAYSERVERVERYQSDQERGRSDQAKQTRLGSDNVPHSDASRLAAAERDIRQGQSDTDRRDSLGDVTDATSVGRHDTPSPESREHQERRCARATGGSCCALPNTDRERQLQPQGSICGERQWTGDGCEDAADTDLAGSQGYGRLCECPGEWAAWKGRRPFQGIWQSEPAVGRVAHGIPARVDRLRALGNAVVPQQVYPILAAIYEQIMQERGA